MIFKIKKEDGKCCYEEWSRERSDMWPCEKLSKVTAGGKFVCNEHLPHALAADKSPTLIDAENNTIPTKVLFKTLAGCK